MRTFLIALAVQQSKHHVRAASRRRRALARYADEERPAVASPPDEAWRRRELAEELQRALDRLPLAERVVVVLCEIEERTAAEVASIVDAPEVTVRTRLHRARHKLRAMLGEPP